jgi:hypothetical protein
MGLVADQRQAGARVEFGHAGAELGGRMAAADDYTLLVHWQVSSSVIGRAPRYCWLGGR